MSASGPGGERQSGWRVPLRRRCRSEDVSSRSLLAVGFTRYRARRLRSARVRSRRRRVRIRRPRGVVFGGGPSLSSPGVSGQVADSDQMLTMRAMQERRDPTAAPSQFPQTRQQPRTLVLRRGGGVTGGAVRRLRQRQQGITLVPATISAEAPRLVVFNPETDAIVGPMRTVTSFRVADGLGDDLGDSLGFLVGEEVAGAGDRDQVRMRTGCKRSALFVG